MPIYDYKDLPEDWPTIRDELHESFGAFTSVNFLYDAAHINTNTISLNRIEPNAQNPQVKKQFALLYAEPRDLRTVGNA